MLAPVTPGMETAASCRFLQRFRTKTAAGQGRRPAKLGGGGTPRSNPGCRSRPPTTAAGCHRRPASAARRATFRRGNGAGPATVPRERRQSGRRSLLRESTCRADSGPSPRRAAQYADFHRTQKQIQLLDLAVSPASFGSCSKGATATDGLGARGKHLSTNIAAISHRLTYVYVKLGWVLLDDLRVLGVKSSHGRGPWPRFRLKKQRHLLRRDDGQGRPRATPGGGETPRSDPCSRARPPRTAGEFPACRPAGPIPGFSPR